MNSNREMLDRLFASGGIRLGRGSIFDLVLGAKPPGFDFGKVEGMLLGLAIGDALGNTTEGKLPSQRSKEHGEIRDYLPNRHVGGARVGLPSDDTQLAFWTLEQLIDDRSFVPQRVAVRFSKDTIFGIGSTVRQFRDNLQRGKPWEECGPQSAGNGSLMRIAPIVVPHLRTGGADLWVDTALCAMITHNDAAAIAACMSLVALIWDALDMTRAPAPEWWLDRYVAIARELETGTAYVPRGGKFQDYSGPVWTFIRDKVASAYHKRLPVREACDEWYSGAYLMETLPSVIYILMRHGHDLEEAMVRAVNDTKDNDTVAAIVGAAVGALHGKAAVPQRWIDGLSGRTTDRDDGRLSELISRGRTTFWNFPASPVRGIMLIN